MSSERTKILTRAELQGFKDFVRKVVGPPPSHEHPLDLQYVDESDNQGRYFVKPGNGRRFKYVTEEQDRCVLNAITAYRNTLIGEAENRVGSKQVSPTKQVKSRRGRKTATTLLRTGEARPSIEPSLSSPSGSFSQSSDWDRNIASSSPYSTRMSSPEWDAFNVFDGPSSSMSEPDMHSSSWDSTTQHHEDERDPFRFPHTSVIDLYVYTANGVKPLDLRLKTDKDQPVTLGDQMHYFELLELKESSTIRVYNPMADDWEPKIVGEFSRSHLVEGEPLLISKDNVTIYKDLAFYCGLARNAVAKGLFARAGYKRQSRSIVDILDEDLPLLESSQQRYKARRLNF